ncbi:protein CLEC16A isoform X1 [Electrophorus electricus]|uniref:protein CLEC16A isoform X1 n=1 Tax=Electrophorus electricus TaxID=8005 RepID=UPI0015D0B19C|nr:protein CLEC16A isoform X1 [Electrophorus electricus]
MFGRSRSWVGGQGKSKNIHSLDHLKYMYHVLTKNTTVTDHNRNLLVETIRSITEILIWGDQNDSSVFDFFLEKNMFAFFLNILRQKSGRYVCVQLLQTLNILFENISHETSLYYLLSNNHVNSIIVHKFDFSDEEIMAYYISFLKTLSLKLNNHTVHFFYNEHTNDFALYTEAIKFFNHPESMVRIAVRTITLNVYKVSLDNQHMLHYIRDKTAVPYFSNLVWFIGSHVIELDKCVQTDEEHKNKGKLSDLVAEHLDHLHYLNDILIINCEFLNDVLTDHLLNRLFLPLYVYSLVSQEQCEDRKINPQVSLYLLSQVFLIIHYQPLVNALADVILNGDLSVFSAQPEQNALKSSSSAGVRRFTKPAESLERSLEMSRQRGRKKVQKRPNYKNVGEEEEEERGLEEGLDEEKEKAKGTEASSKASRTSGDTEEIEMVVMEKCKVSDVCTLTEQNITDEEKTAAAACTEGQRSRPFLDMVYSALDCEMEDYHALFVLCLLFALSHSKGINPKLLEKIQLPVPGQKKSSYSQVLVERLIRVMNHATQPDGRVRLATLELSCLLLKQSVLSGIQCIIKDVHLACLEGAREESLHLLRRFYKGEEIFLDMFEDEYRSMTSKPLNVEYLMMDASILLPPTGTPLTGIDFVKRLPCGDVEKTRRAIRVFFMLRALSLQLQGEPETQLPLTRPEDLIKTDDVLDLNNSDLIACMVVSKDGVQAQRFLAVDIYQMSLVEPDTKRLGWGVVKFAGLLQDMQVSGVEDDSRALNITIHKPTSNPHAKPLPILQASFIFADHIRCIIAKQRLAKGRIQARRMKMQRIAALLDLPVQPSSEVVGFGQTSASASQLPFRFYDQARRGPAFASVDKVPGFAVAHVAQHTPTPPSNGSVRSGRCDSDNSSSVSVQSAMQNPSALCPALAPSLTPTAQPTISLLSDADGDALSVDSLTLLPPTDPPHLRPLRSAAAGLSLEDTGSETSIVQVDEEEEEEVTTILKEDEPSSDSEAAEVSPPGTCIREREESEDEPRPLEANKSADPIPQCDSEHCPDVEQETEID